MRYFLESSFAESSHVLITFSIKARYDALDFLVQEKVIRWGKEIMSAKKFQQLCATINFKHNYTHIQYCTSNHRNKSKINIL